MMKTIEDIANQMICEITIIKELNDLRIETRKTNNFIDIVIFDLSCFVINRFLGLTDWGDSHEDNLTVNRSDYDQSQIKQIEDLRLKYRCFRNKVIAHTTTTEITAKATPEDLEIMLSIVQKINTKCCKTGTLRYFLKPMLNTENKSEVN